MRATGEEGEGKKEAGAAGLGSWPAKPVVAEMPVPGRLRGGEQIELFPPSPP